MQNNIFINEILKRFSPEEVKSLAYSLSHDPILWGEVNDQNRWGNFDNVASLRYLDFRPGCLALKALGVDITVDQLSKIPLVTLPKNTRLSAIGYFEETIKLQKQPATLADAALLALALRERRRIVHSWVGLTQEIAQPLNGEAVNPEIWKTTFSCLFSMVPDSHDLLKTLVRDGQWQVFFPVVSHTLLTNLLSDVERVDFFKELLREVSLEIRVEWLRQLRLNGEKSLVAAIANELIEAVAKEDDEMKTPGLGEVIQCKTGQIKRLESLSCLYQYAGRGDLCMETIRQMQRELNTVNDLLDIRELETRAQNGDLDQVAQDEKMINLKSLAGDAATEAVFLLGDFIRSDEVPSGDEAQGESAIKTLAKVKMMARKDLSDSEKENLALEIEKMMTDIARDNRNSFLQIASDWDAASLVKTLDTLGLSDCAVKNGEILLQKRPADINLISAIASSYEKSGRLDDAVQFARRAMAMDPRSADLHRKVAKLWEMRKDWLNAFDEWSRVQQLVNRPEISDLLNYGKAATRSNQPHHALEAFQKVLDEDPENVDAHLLMAEALLDLGQPSEAISHLERPSLMVVDQPESWLLLSKAYSMIGKKEKSKEILKLGVSALPESAELNNAMAKAIVNDGDPQDAVPYFKKAQELAPDSDQMLIDLGRTLRMLGRQEEAIALFKEAFQRWPDNIQIGYLLAELLIDLGQGQDALPVLEGVLENGGKSFDRLMIYVDVLMGGGHDHFDQKIPEIHLAKALDAVNSALEIEPDSLKAKIIRAELLNRSGRHEDALKAYKAIDDDQRVEEWTQDLECRFAKGFGLAALDEGEYDLAIMHFEKAAALDPDQESLQKKLCEAYFGNGQIDEGLKTARKLLETDPGNIQNANWFAEKAKAAGDFSAAEAALLQVAELNPANPEAWINLAEFFIRREDGSRAREALDRVLLIPETGARCLRKVARAYYEIEEVTSALLCLERALLSETEKTPELYIEVAAANMAAGNLEIALQGLRQAEDIYPDDYRFQVIAGDIQGFTGHSTMALASLENALKRMENGNSLSAQPQDFIALPKDRPENWLSSLSNPPQIFQRYSLFERLTGDLETAEAYLKNAMDLEQENMVIRYSMADLAQAMLDYDRALDLSDCSLILPSHRENFLVTPATTHWKKDTYVNMNCLQAEIALTRNMEDHARQVFKNIKEASAVSPRVGILQARLLMRDGQFSTAKDIYEKALDAWNQDPLAWNFSPTSPFFDPVEYIASDDRGWMIQAELEIHEWDAAFEKARLLVKQAPDEPLNQLLFAKMLAGRAEFQRLGEEIGCVNHCPGSDALSEEMLALFEKTIQKIQTLVGAENPELTRLAIRGAAVFRPTEQNIQKFQEMNRDADDTAVLVMLLRQRDLIKEAVKESKRFPTSSSIQMQLALSAGKFECEIDYPATMQTMEISSSDPITLTAYSILAENAGDYSQAYQLASKALSIWSDEPEWHARLAKLAEKTGQVELQNLHWKNASEMDPQNIVYRIGYGESLLKSGRVSESVQQLSKANEISPENEEVLLLLSKAHIQQSQYGQAIECCERVIRNNPEALDAMMMGGQIALKMHHLDKAFDFAKKFVKLDPKNPRALLLLSNALVEQGKDEEALTVLDHAVNLIGPDPSVLLERARLIYKNKGAQSALPYLEDLVKLDPENVEALCQLAGVQIEGKLFDEANNTLHMALEIDPESPEINLMMGRLQKQQGQLDKALFYLTRAVQASPVNAEPYIELANTYQERKEYQQALNLYQKAIHIKPNDDRPYFQSALVMREVKDFQGAETMLRKAAQLSPNDLSVRRQLSAVIALNLVHHASEANSLL